MNINDDYDTLKTIYCHIHRVRPQDIKDTRHLSVKIMNKLVDSNLEYITICSNLLRGIKSKICRSQGAIIHDDSVEDDTTSNAFKGNIEEMNVNSIGNGNSESIEVKKRRRKVGYFKPYIELNSRHK